MATRVTTSGTLKLEKGKFVLYEIADSKLRMKMHRDPYWRSIGNDSYSTKYLSAAIKYRKVADEKTERTLDKVLQKFYNGPGNRLDEVARTLRKLPLDPHQYDGILWVLSRKRSYLAHAPGAGKTAEAIIAACLSEGSDQYLFIVPPSLVKNWEREIRFFTEWLGIWPAIGVVPASPARETTPWRAQFLICPDSMLAKDWVYEGLSKIKKQFIAVDEASRFKDPFAERSIAFYGGKNEKSKYSGLFREARHVVLLDGSPMPNRPIELWAPSFALDPEAIGCLSYNDFGYRYGGARPNERGEWEFLFSSNEAELKERLQKSFMHVVPESKLNHPERKRKMVFVDDVRSEEHREWESKNLSRFEKQVMFWGTAGAEECSQGEAARFRKELGIRKIPLIVKYTKERLEKGEAVLLFVWHREVATQVSRGLAALTGCRAIIGGVDTETRDECFRQFQDGASQLLVMNIAAAGRGLNLQRADRIIFGEFSWTDQTNLQCEKRASRKGSERAEIPCDYLVCPNSMDEIVLRSVFSKEKRVKKVIG